MSFNVSFDWIPNFIWRTNSANEKEQQLTDKSNEPSIELPRDNTSLTEVTKKTRNIDRIDIINDELRSISLLGARIDDLVLKNIEKLSIQKVIG